MAESLKSRADSEGVTREEAPGAPADPAGGDAAADLQAVDEAAARAGDPDGDLRAVAEVARARDAITTEIGKKIVGQEEVVDHLLTALFARGHSLFVGVPGLAKTLLISTLAESLNLHFQRIQFTPDLMPSDITGTDVLEEDQTTGKRVFRFIHGPVFTNLLLADEINRTPPKTQAALLQSMQEYQVTAGGQTFELARPFQVFATQNPIEQEGTYPLPEAQLDRFMLQIDVGYPTAEEEIQIALQQTSDYEPSIRPILSPERIVALQDLVRRVPVAEHVVRYAVTLARRTRPSESDAPDFVRTGVSWGAGPRASQYLILAAKARAILGGRFAASAEDVRALARPVLQHRILVSYRAEAEGTKSGDIVDRLLAAIPE